MTYQEQEVFRIFFKLFPKQIEALKILRDNETEELLYGGGAGGGKSVLGCYWQITNRIKYPGTRGFIGRNVLKDLKDSTQKRFWEVCHLLDQKPGRDYRFNQTDQVVTWSNGSETNFRQLSFQPSDPDFTNLGSTEYTDAFIDEAPDITERAYEILNSRIRYRLNEYGLIPKILVTGNPTYGWLRDKFVKDKFNNFIELPPHIKRVLATIVDNKDKGFAELYAKKLAKMNEYDRARLLDGDWDAVERTGGEYFPPFKREVHVRPTKYDPNYKLHLTFDFNYIPFMTMILYQIKYLPQIKRYLVSGLGEYCLTSPDNSTKAVCKAFAEDYRKHLNGILYYGDYSGYNQGTHEYKINGRDIKHQYDIVEAMLYKYIDQGSCRTITNQSVKQRREFMNAILEGETYIDFELDPSMQRTIAEFQFMKQGRDGGKHVELTMDIKTKVKYEKWGHPTDATEYFFISAFNDEFKEHSQRFKE